MALSRVIKTGTGTEVQLPPAYCSGPAFKGLRGQILKCWTERDKAQTSVHLSLWTDVKISERHVMLREASGTARFIQSLMGRHRSLPHSNMLGCTWCKIGTQDVSEIDPPWLQHTLF